MVVDQGYARQVKDENANDGQVSINYDAHHTSSSGILNAIATTEEDLVIRQSK
ncbi:MAG: hypothetical protein CM15mV142_350 [Caudoviricetes sp.]|nr:MAG: hypothetical protein CM15mV142_350 [Caudoviricetes sp.]